jgi:hypothetical protein
MTTKKTPDKRKPSVLTEQQEEYVEGVLDGKAKSHAALDAGYSHGSQSHRLDRNELVQTALAERREELSSATQITRAGVLNGILDAIEMARVMADPMAMLAGYRDISKMMGYNAPEVKKVEISDTSNTLARKIKSMSDEDLLNVIEGEARLVD